MDVNHWLKTAHCCVCSQLLLVKCTIADFCWGKVLAVKGKRAPSTVGELFKHCPHSMTGGIRRDPQGAVWRGVGQCGNSGEEAFGG